MFALRRECPLFTIGLSGLLLLQRWTVRVCQGSLRRETPPCSRALPRVLVACTGRGNGSERYAIADTPPPCKHEPWALRLPLAHAKRGPLSRMLIGVSLYLGGSNLRH